MKASKFIVLVGGILGILAFFLPLISVQRDNFNGTVSAFQVVKGLDVASAAVDSADARAAMTAESHDQAKQDLGAVKGIVLAVFVPALLLALIGALGIVRKRFGRGAAALSLVIGLIGLGIAAILKSASEGDSGIGITLLLITGLAGVVGGIAALVKPERAARAVPATTPAELPLVAA